MIVAAETCDCVGPMIGSGWLDLLGTIAVVGPALVASVVRHRRRPELPADDPLLAPFRQTAAGDEHGPDPRPEREVTAGRSDQAAPAAIAATASTEARRQDVG